MRGGGDSRAARQTPLPGGQPQAPPRPQSPRFSAQGLPGSRAGSGPVRGAAGGDQGGGGEGLLAAGRLTPRRKGPWLPAGRGPRIRFPSAGGRARPRPSWTQRRSQPLPRIPSPPPHATAASINPMICSQPGLSLTGGPFPSVTLVYQSGPGGPGQDPSSLPPPGLATCKSLISPASVSSWGWAQGKTRQMPAVWRHLGETRSEQRDAVQGI